MTLASRTFLVAGALALLLAVIFGAYGAHGLQGNLSPADWDAYQTAVQYQFFHGLGLMVAALVTERCPSSRLVQASGWLLLAGIIFFCGAIFATSFGAPEFVGLLAPVGGSAFMLGWLALGLGAVRA